MRSVWTAVLFGIAGLLAGLWIASARVDVPGPLGWAQDLGEQSLADEVSELVEDYYYRPVGGRALDRASVDGIVERLRKRYDDRFTHYFDPEQLARFEDSIDGTFSGVGMTVGDLSDRGLVVGRVFEGSPAEREGIERGDVITSVDGESLRGEDVDGIVARIKGPEGTSVVLGVRPGGDEPERRIELVREEIEVPVSEGRVIRRDGRRFGYVSLAAFSEGAGDALRRSLRKVTGQGVDGIVLDLRGNGGGLLPEAVSTSSLFAPAGRKVVVTSSRSEGDRIYRTTGGELDLPPIVVLIDRGTASAAEILAAAVRRYRGAPLVGTRSFGKGLFQQLIELEGGGALDLSVGEFLTAEDESLAGRGLTPDVNSAEGRRGTDRQLERALAVLRDESN